MEKHEKSVLTPIGENLLTFEHSGMTIHVLGGVSLQSLDRLRLTLKVFPTGSKNPAMMIRSSVDLYHLEQVETFTRRLSDFYQMSERESTNILLELTAELEQYRLHHYQGLISEEQVKELTETEREEAIKYLRQENLLERISTDLEKAGIIGEEINRKIVYLILTSRKLENPLHLIIQGKTGSGKSHLIESIAKLFPKEEVIEVNSLSDNSLFYFEENALKNKILIVEDLDGAGNSLYAIREMQSKKKLSKIIPLKDPRGRIRTVIQTVNGPMVIASTTTKEKIYTDNTNRSVILHPDESEQQDQRIMNYQRRKSAGEKSNTDELKQLKNIQYLLQPIRVINPYATLLTLPENLPYPRRLNQIYLGIIEVITFLYQYHRKRMVMENSDQTFIETDPEDIRLAHELMLTVFNAKCPKASHRSLEILEIIKENISEKENQTFSQTELRKELKEISPFVLKESLTELKRTGHLIAEGTKERGYTYSINDNNINGGQMYDVAVHLEKTYERVKKISSVSAAEKLLKVRHNKKKKPAAEQLSEKESMNIETELTEHS